MISAWNTDIINNIATILQVEHNYFCYSDIIDKVIHDVDYDAFHDYGPVKGVQGRSFCKIKNLIDIIKF